MGQEVPEVNQGARAVQPSVHAAFQSILAIGAGCSPFIALHLWIGDVAENSSELPFFRAMAADVLAWDKLRSPVTICLSGLCKRKRALQRLQ